MGPPRCSRVPSPAMRVHVVRRGTGQPLVFLHGVGSSSETWSTVMSLLEDRYTTVAFDLLGHGASPVLDDPAEYSRDRALEDLDDVLATLDEPAVLVGHSLGGYLSLAHSATRPGVVRGIVVLNTGPGFRDPEKREAWNERSRRNAHRFGVPPQAAELNLQEDSIVMERLSAIEVPVLALAGEEDRPEYSASGQYLVRKMPDARFVSIPGGGHDMHERSHAAQIAAMIDDFARELDS